jgi:methyltransferase-like protein
MIAPDLPSNALEHISELARGDAIALQQYLDFVLFRGFRRTLLCRSGVPLERDVIIDRMSRLWVASPLRRTDKRSRAGFEYKNSQGSGTYTTRHPLMLAVLEHLEILWPHAAPFSSLITEGMKVSAESREDTEQNLAANLLRLAANSLVDLRTHRVTIADQLGSHPTATPLERLQAKEGTVITTPLHTSVDVSDEQVRWVIQLLDGEHDVSNLLNSFASRYPNLSREAAKAQMSTILRTLHKLGVLIA